MRIAVDIDGVLLDFMVTFCEVFNKNYGTNYKKKEVINWEFFRDWNISEKVVYDIFYEIYENTMLVPIIDSKVSDYLRNINKNHEVYILTARSKRFGTQIENKLKSHNIRKGIEYIELILVDHKPYDLKLKIDFDIYIDDSPNLVEPIKLFTKRYLLLFDQPWNQNSICEKNVYRVKTWKEICEIIGKLEK